MQQTRLPLTVPGGRQPRPQESRRSPASCYRYGAAKERSLAVKLRQERGAWHVFRVAGSRGAADLIGTRADGLLLVQVKSGVARPTPGEIAKAMDALRSVPAPPGTRLQVWYWSSEARQWELVDSEEVSGHE